MKITKLSKDAILPTRKHPTDAGLDLYSTENVMLNSFSSEIVHTEIAVELPENTFGLIMPKSRNFHLVGAGVVDQNYRGELLVKAVNYSPVILWIKKGEPIAQLIVVPILTPEIEEVSQENFSKETDRGATGGIVSQLKSATFTSKIKE